MKRILYFLVFIFPVFASAQLQDDFSDGDFTANPAWSGNTSTFIVNGSQQLQLNATVAGTSYLTLSENIPSLDNTEWRFWIHMDLSASSSNFCRVFLVSDQSDLSGSLNGYYLQFGETGSNDAIELFKKTGTTSVSVLRGTNAEIFDPFTVGVKVTRDASGLWSLYVDPAGGSTYVLEATGTDASITTSSYFGVLCTYTVTNVLNSFFDDFFIPSFADVTPPTVISATAISNTQLDILFSEPVQESSAEIVSNFAVDNGINGPTSATLDGSNAALVHLVFATPFVSATTYTVTVTNVQDLAGNAITTNNSATFTFSADVIPPTLNGATAVSSTQLDVLFSEDVDLATSQTAINYSVDNGIGSPSSAQRDVSDLSLLHLTFSNSFSDGINYTLTVNNVNDVAGNTINANSTAAFTFSTPSAAVPYDVVITEFMPDPDPVIGLPEVEFVEIYNRSNKTFDLNAWKFSDAGAPHDLPSYILTPGSYLILCSPADTALLSPFGNTLGIPSFPSLNNTGGEDIIIYDNNSIIIDKIHYDETWYHDEAKLGFGWSIERIDPDFTCAASGNWKASVDPAGGTPGRINSIDGTYSDVTSPRLVRACLEDSLHLTLFFSEPIPDSALSNIQNYTILESEVIITGGVTGVSAAADGMSVSLTLLTSAATGNWTAVVSQTFSDCAGNYISQNEASFGTPVPASPGDVLINEVLFSVDNGATDFVELYNVSSKILDLARLKINNYSSSGNPNTQVPISDGCFIMFPATYVALSESATLIKAHYTILDENAFLDMDLPALLSEEDRVVLKNNTGEVIDSLHYFADWHLPLLTDEHNVSLERLSISRNTNDPGNWHSAAETAGFATPGYKNSQQSEAGSGSSDITIEPEVFSPDNDGYNDVVNILFHFSSPGYVANVKVFDSKGRPVRTLVENQLLGNDGTFSWDGISDDKEKARTGIYVFYIEVFNQNGDVKEYKKTCVLATRL